MILRPWVAALGLREQGVLVVSTRGCDSAPKFPLDSPERRLTAALRWSILIPFDEREVDSAPGCFMMATPPMDLKIAMLEHYPMHWVMHVVHAMEALMYRMPDKVTADEWGVLYLRSVKSLHLQPETFSLYLARLTEDRVANNTIVSL